MPILVAGGINRNKSRAKNVRFNPNHTSYFIMHLAMVQCGCICVLWCEGCVCVYVVGCVCMDGCMCLLDGCVWLNVFVCLFVCVCVGVLLDGEKIMVIR